MLQETKGVMRKITNLFARGIIRLVRDDYATQTVQASLLADESRDNLENAQPYGFTYHPLTGAECIAIFFGGNRDHGSVITVFDKRYRPKNLKPGEVCIYDDQGTRIHLKRGKIVEIVGDLEVKGNIKASGEITDASKSMAQMRAAYNSHKHPDPHGGQTGEPNPPM